MPFNPSHHTDPKLSTLRVDLLTTLNCVQAELRKKELCLSEKIDKNPNIPEDVKYILRVGAFPGQRDEDQLIAFDQAWLWSNLSEILKIEWSPTLLGLTVHKSDGSVDTHRLEQFECHFYEGHSKALSKLSSESRRLLRQNIDSGAILPLYIGNAGFFSEFKETPRSLYLITHSRTSVVRLPYPMSLSEFITENFEEINALTRESQVLLLKGLLDDPETANDLRSVISIDEDLDYGYLHIKREGATDLFFFHTQSFDDFLKEFKEKLASFPEIETDPEAREAFKLKFINSLKDDKYSPCTYRGLILDFHFEPNASIRFDFRSGDSYHHFLPMSPQEFYERYVKDSNLSEDGHRTMRSYLADLREPKDWMRLGLILPLSESISGAVKIEFIDERAEPTFVCEAMDTPDFFIENLVTDNPMLSEHSKVFLKTLAQQARGNEMLFKLVHLRGLVYRAEDDLENSRILLHTIDKEIGVVYFNVKRDNA